MLEGYNFNKPGKIEFEIKELENPEFFELFKKKIIFCREEDYKEDAEETKKSKTEEKEFRLEFRFYEKTKNGRF